MSISKFIPIVLLLSALGCKVQQPVPVAALPIEEKFNLNNKIDSISYGMAVSIAHNIKTQGLDSVNAEAMAEAFRSVFNGDSLLISAEDANAFLRGFFQELHEKKMEEGIKLEKEFFEQNKVKEGVVTLPSGMQYKVIKEGNGAKPTAEQTVKVHYHGTLISGKVFDSSVERGEPVSFPVGQVIPGWTEALQLMPVGSKWMLYIPSQLAYGERGAGAEIGPNTPLVFEVELLEIVEE